MIACSILDMHNGKLVCVRDLVISIDDGFEENYTRLETEDYDRLSIEIDRRVQKDSYGHITIQKILSHVPRRITYLKLVFSTLDDDVVFDFPDHIKFARFYLPTNESIVPRYSFLDSLPLSLEGISCACFVPFENPPPSLRLLHFDSNVRSSSSDKSKDLGDSGYVSDLFHKIPSLERVYFREISISAIPKISGLDVVLCESYFYFYKRK